jgi:hypothetical protein
VRPPFFFDATATSEHVVPATTLTNTTTHSRKDDFHLGTLYHTSLILSIFQKTHMFGQQTPVFCPQ